MRLTKASEIGRLNFMPSIEVRKCIEVMSKDRNCSMSKVINSALYNSFVPVTPCLNTLYFEIVDEYLEKGEATVNSRKKLVEAVQLLKKNNLKNSAPICRILRNIGGLTEISYSKLKDWEVDDNQDVNDYADLLNLVSELKYVTKANVRVMTIQMISCWSEVYTIPETYDFITFLVERFLDKEKDLRISDVLMFIKEIDAELIKDTAETGEMTL